MKVKKLRESTIKKVLAIVLILAVQYPMFTLATNQIQEQSFLTSSKKEVEAGETIQLTLNLSKIDYESFEFELNSSANNLNTIQVENESVSTTKAGDKLIITEQKSSIDVDKITLNYTVPTNIETGNIVTLTGVVINSEDETNSQDVTITIKITEKKNNNQNQEQNQASNNSQIFSDNKGRAEGNAEMENGDMKQMQNGMNGENDVQGNGITANSKSSTNGNQSNAIGTSMSGMQETNTYNGESNNYLTSLSVQGYNFTTEFSKTKTTYFVNVANDVTSLQINTEAEDENATVTVYGNESIKSGQNKILISVTAENGDVKTYRIYVNKS